VATKNQTGAISSPTRLAHGRTSIALTDLVNAVSAIVQVRVGLTMNGLNNHGDGLLVTVSDIQGNFLSTPVELAELADNNFSGTHMGSSPGGTIRSWAAATIVVPQIISDSVSLDFWNMLDTDDVEVQSIGLFYVE